MWCVCVHVTCRCNLVCTQHVTMCVHKKVYKRTRMHSTLKCLAIAITMFFKCRLCKQRICIRYCQTYMCTCCVCVHITCRCNHVFTQCVSVYMCLDKNGLQMNFTLYCLAIIMFLNIVFINKRFVSNIARNIFTWCIVVCLCTRYVQV